MVTIKQCILFLALAIGFFNCTSESGHKQSATSIHRIISLAPSITETLFALHLDTCVVGVTDFCTYPPVVKQLPKVGGYIDPNYEQMVALKPDLVILMKEHSAVADFLKKAAIRSLLIDNHNLTAICSSFVQIGALCNRSHEADSIVASITAEAVSPADTKKARPRVVVCIGRDNIGGKSISTIYAAGVRTFYDDIITAAGGQNALHESMLSNLEYPQISAEGIVQIAPDIIIELISPMTPLSASAVQNDWRKITTLIKSRTRVVVLKNEYATVPGPRIGMTLHDFKNIIANTYAADQ